MSLIKTIHKFDFDLESNRQTFDETYGRAEKFGQVLRSLHSDVRPLRDGWELLTIDIVNKGTKGKNPVELEFPDCKRVQFKPKYKSKRWTNYWKCIMIESTGWLLDNCHLTRDCLPIRRYGKKSNKHNAVSTAPYHPDGRRMKSVKVSGVYVATDYIDDHCVRNTIAIIKEAGQDLSEFRIRFS